MPLTIKERLIADKHNVRYGTAEYRIKVGWDKERALTEKPSNWVQTAKKHGVGASTFSGRRQAGWSEKEAATTPVDKRFRHKGGSKNENHQDTQAEKRRTQQNPV